MDVASLESPPLPADDEGMTAKPLLLLDVDGVINDLELFEP